MANNEVFRDKQIYVPGHKIVMNQKCESLNLLALWYSGQSSQRNDKSTLFSQLYSMNDIFFQMDIHVTCR